VAVFRALFTNLLTFYLFTYELTGTLRLNNTNNNNNNNNPICKAPECQKTSVALKLTEYEILGDVKCGIWPEDDSLTTFH